MFINDEIFYEVLTSVVKNFKKNNIKHRQQ